MQQPKTLLADDLVERSQKVDGIPFRGLPYMCIKMKMVGECECRL
jgi:hypothetical protein